jgi:diguanylate cyclase (GGDEF)-like protein
MLSIYFEPILLKIKDLPSWVEGSYRIVSDSSDANIIFITDAIKCDREGVEYLLVQSQDELKQNIDVLFNDHVHLIEADLNKKVILKKLNSVSKNIFAKLNKELFRLPLKIKSDEMLMDEILKAAARLNINLTLEIFVKTKGLKELKRETDTIPKKVFQKIIETDIEKPIIGRVLEIETNKNLHLAFPVYEVAQKQSWIISKPTSPKDHYFFSENFFQYIENTLIYRKSLDKQMSFKLLSDIDDVTGLFNQRKLMSDLESLILKYKDSEKNFSVMFIDVDHFKKVNDNYGHLVGSKILVDIGNELRSLLRDSDLIYRYGGDEFVVVMPNVSRSVVHNVAKRVLDSIKSKEFYIKENENYNLTISIGLAEYPIDAMTVKDIIRFADEMMYISKNTGRGKIFHISEVK